MLMLAAAASVIVTSSSPLAGVGIDIAAEDLAGVAEREALF
jgi:hypothetical protein